MNPWHWALCNDGWHVSSMCVGLEITIWHQDDCHKPCLPLPLPCGHVRDQMGTLCCRWSLASDTVRHSHCPRRVPKDHGARHRPLMPVGNRSQCIRCRRPVADSQRNSRQSHTVTLFNARQASAHACGLSTGSGQCHCDNAKDSANGWQWHGQHGH